MYPDQLLSQILMASTYPLEIVEAARWVSIPGNRLLRGEALTRALDEHDDVAAVIVEPTGATFGLVPLVGGFLAVAYDWQVQTASGPQTLAGLQLPSIIGQRR